MGIRIHKVVDSLLADTVTLFRLLEQNDAEIGRAGLPCPTNNLLTVSRSLLLV